MREGTGKLAPALTDYDRRVLAAVEEKARSTWWITGKVEKRLLAAMRRLSDDRQRLVENEVWMVLSGLAHLGYIERVSFGRWRLPR